MKVKDLYGDLLELAKQIGITVRKEGGKFKSGYCILNEEDIIIINRSATIETTTKILAKALAEREIDNIYIKPVLREYIEKEKESAPVEKNFSLEVNY